MFTRNSSEPSISTYLFSGPVLGLLGNFPLNTGKTWYAATAPAAPTLEATGPWEAELLQKRV